MGLVHILAWAAFAVQPIGSQEAPGDVVMRFPETDAEMNKAKAKAVASCPDFLSHFDNPAADETDFMVKYDVDPSDAVEFVWATVSVRSGASLQGMLINQPEHTQDRLGDGVAIRQADIVDWGYRKTGVMQGSFTTRVMLAQMPEAEAAEYRTFLGW